MPVIHENDGNTDYWMLHALRVIKKEFGHTVSVHREAKDLLKFGRNEVVGASDTTIAHWPTGITNESYVSSNLITSIISTSAADGESVVVEGHTVSSGVFTYLSQTVTLNGQTAVTLGTALARVSRVYNDDSTELAGVISVTQNDTYTAGVPDTPSKVHLHIAAGDQNSNKAATTIEDGKYWIITEFYGDILDKSSAFAEIHLEIRLKGKIFRNSNMKSASDGHDAQHLFQPYLIVPPNSDVRLTAVADGVNTDIAGGIEGVLAVVVT